MERPDRPRGGGDPIEQTQGSQGILARGLQQEARPHRPGRFRLLEDRDLVPVLRHGDGQRPASDPEPDDPDAHATTIPAT